jgi:hypothetical protein
MMGRLLLLLLLLVPASAAAQSEELSVDARARCIQSMVRIEVDTPRGTLSGSGTFIDPRGYILTNFHVVGHLGHETGTPGVHHNTRFRVAVVHTERGLVVDEYLAEVVRGHVTLDLAIIHIVSRVDETPLGGAPFTAMTVRRDVPSLGSRVWALGFPTGVRTINVTAGQVAGFEDNNAGDAAWMRTDTEFNPGNSGGALIDRDCRLVGVPTAVSRAAIEPIELARPSARVPAHWITALASGADVTPEPTEGFREIAMLTEIADAEAGDSSGRSGEVRYYRLPAARPGVVTLSPRLELGAIGPGGRIIRRGSGQVLITSSDGPNTLIAVVVPRGRDGRAPTVRLRFTPMREADAALGVASTGDASVSGVLSRADGSACATYVALAPSSLDAASVLAAIRDGRERESALRRSLLALSPLAADGSFTLRAPSGSYALLIVGPSGLEERREIDLTTSGVELGAVILEAACR